MRESLFSLQVRLFSLPNRGGGKPRCENMQTNGPSPFNVASACAAVHRKEKVLPPPPPPLGVWGPVLLPAGSERQARARRPGVNRDARRAAGGSMEADKQASVLQRRRRRCCCVMLFFCGVDLSVCLNLKSLERR